MLGFWQIVGRGIKGRCPQCGEGKLFSRYLKQVECCTACGEAFGHIRADDGPAWLTILLVGHILSVILLGFVAGNDWPVAVSMVVWPAFALVLALLILPRAKGAFIAAIWRMNCSGAER